MKNRKMLILAASLTLVSLLFAFVTFKPQAQDRNQQQDEDPPTTVQRGIMTEKQRKHSKLYRRQTSPAANLISESGDVDWIILDHEDTTDHRGQSPPSQVEYLQKLTCDSDSIVIAKVKNKASQLTEHFNFVFTDYDLNVEQVLKNDSNLDIQTIKNITLHTPGGAVKVDNRTIKIKFERKTPIRVGGEYIFFLDYLSDSDSFRLSSARGVFLVSGNKIKTPQNAYVESTDNKADFISLIAEAATKCSTILGGK